MKSLNVKSFLKHISPWVVAVGMLAYLFQGIDMRQFSHALLQADAYIYLLWLTLFILLWFLLDTHNLYAAFRYFNHEIPYKEVLSIRGVSYLLYIINYNLSVGAIAYYLKRDNGIPLLRSAALMLFYSIATQISLYVMAAFGSLFLLGSSVILNTIFYWSAGLFAAYAIMIIIFKSLPQRGIIRKLKNITLIQIFDEASLRTYLLLCFWISLYYSTFIFFYYVATRAFHMEIPLLALAAYVPMIAFVYSLPVTHFGMGTSQAAMLILFKDYGSEANILAFSIVYSISVLIFRGILGLLYAKKIVAYKTEAKSALAGGDSYEKA